MPSGDETFPTLTVDPQEGTVAGPAGTVRLEPKVMQVLLVLAGKAGQLVARGELFDAVWPNAVVTEHTLSRCIYQLRDQLGKVGGNAEFDPIETLPKRGYRLRTPIVTPALEGPTRDRSTPFEPGRIPLRHMVAAGAWLLIGVATAALFYLLYPRMDDRLAETTAPIVSVAVLPFENRSPDPDNAYFADGLHDDLITVLSKLDDLRVTSRTSVEAYRNTEATIPMIGEDLGVTHVIEGAVQRIDDRIRVNVQLIDAAADDHVWAERYDKRLSAQDIFAIQSDIAASVSEALRTTLSTEEQQRLSTLPTNNLAALEAYFRGKQLLAERTSGALADAVRNFKIATQLDPDFALVHTGLADAYQLRIGYSSVPQDEMLALAKTAIFRAIALDDRLGEAYAGLGHLKSFRGDFVGAELEYVKAIELNPSYAAAHHWYGNLLHAVGRFNDALTQHRAALELDPLSAINSNGVAMTLSSLGQFPQALREFRKSLKLDPTFASGYSRLAGLHWFAFGDLNESARCFARSSSLDPGNPISPAYMAMLYLDLGAADRAEGWAQRAALLAPESAWANAASALLHTYRGDQAQAVASARRVVAVTPHYADARVLQWLALAIARNVDLRQGKSAEARARYQTLYPMLLKGASPTIDFTNYRVAIDLALVLQRTGEQERADVLLSRAAEFLQSIPRLGADGYWISDVQIYALQRRPKEGLAALRNAVDAGWRAYWRYYLERDPNLASLRAEPGFRQIVDELASDMANRLRRSEVAGGSGLQLTAAGGQGDASSC